jgi:hypothetical protein
MNTNTKNYFLIICSTIALTYLAYLIAPIEREESMIATIDKVISSGKDEPSYSHCSAGGAEVFLYKNSRAIKSQIESLRLISENGNIFTFGHISYPSNQLRNLECITKVICQSDGTYAIHDVDCKTF